VFELVLIVIAIAVVVWQLKPAPKRPPPEPAPKYRHDPRISPDQVLWRDFVEEHCESPAEVAFLQAMIGAFKLAPQNGSLIAKDLRLDFQVEEGRYRVDFLVNEWLIVEIDGAAYHSSPEAMARDRIRDRHLEGLGYSVLRIPAKLAFQSPVLTVAKVKEALAVGKRALPPPPPTFSHSQKRAIGQAYDDAQAAMSSEKAALTFALDYASQLIEHEDWLSTLSAEGIESYEQSCRDIEAISSSEIPHGEEVQHPVFLPPTITGDQAVDSFNKDNFKRFTDERESIFSSTSQSLKMNQRLRSRVKDVLVGSGREDLWLRIS
jgi:very-short-patch-repair endonuclease